MARKTQRRIGRWSERPAQVEVASPYTDREPPDRNPRAPERAAGAGPYESSYDVSFGYSHERTIVLP
ncbi:MAG: hypothetical protein KFH98_00070 [Gemmatimonadetes bacterium]|nr:hypothetical protein [Gemmatimonadota bacterium]